MLLSNNIMYVKVLDNYGDTGQIHEVWQGPKPDWWDGDNYGDWKKHPRHSPVICVLRKDADGAYGYFRSDLQVLEPG